MEDFQVIEFSTTIIWALNEGISFGRMVFIHPVKLQRQPEVTRPAVVAPAGPLIAFYMSTILLLGSSPCFAWLPTTKSLLQLTCQTLHIPRDSCPHLQGAKDLTVAHLADLCRPLRLLGGLCTFESWPPPCPHPLSATSPDPHARQAAVCLKTAKLWTSASCYDTITIIFTIFKLAHTQRGFS